MKSRIVIVVLALICISTGVAAFNYMPDYVQRARYSEIKTMFDSFESSEKAYFDEYQKFTENTHELGYLSYNSVNVITKAEEIPDDIRGKLSAEHLPEVTDSNFRVLLIKHRCSNSEVWSKEFNQPPKLVTVL